MRALYRLCEEQSDEAIQTFAWLWIASRRLSSGARSRDPLARNDDERVRRHLFQSGIVPRATSLFQMNSTISAPIVAVMKPAP